MTNEEKQLLIKDICARLPYGVIANYILFDKYSLIGRVYLWTDECFYIKKTDKYSDNWTWNYETATSCAEFDKFKPYLRPMSSMTKEEKECFYQNCLDVDVEDVRYENDGELPLPYCQKDKFIWFENIYIDDVICAIDWLNAHHFDFRGLIEKGLALEAPEGMYDFKQLQL